jgi:DNA-binding LacI/PurR family transcriptional regulator
VSKRLTLDDLSAELKLSKFSISRALRGNKGVSDETRAFVRQAVRDLGYDHPTLRPSFATVAHERQIRLIIPSGDAVDNPYWMGVIGGAEAEARRRGLALVTVMAEDGYLPDRKAGEPAGLILAGRRARGLLEAYLTLDMPMVLIGYPKPGEAIDAVHVAHWEAGCMIGRHLCGLGHRRILYITDAQRDAARAEKLRGCRDAGAPAEVRELVFDPERESGTGELAERICGDKLWPTAIVCAGEFMCFMVMLALSEKRLRVPDDISLVASNSSAQATQMAPDVTSVSAPMAEIGGTAMALLAQRIACGPATLHRRIALTAELIVRGSTRRIELGETP